MHSTKEGNAYTSMCKHLFGFFFSYLNIKSRFPDNSIDNISSRILEAKKKKKKNTGSPRILEWVAYPFSRELSWLRNWTRVCCIAGRFFTNWAIREAQHQKTSVGIVRKSILFNSYSTEYRFEAFDFCFFCTCYFSLTDTDHQIS